MYCTNCGNTYDHAAGPCPYCGTRESGERHTINTEKKKTVKKIKITAFGVAAFVLLSASLAVTAFFMLKNSGTGNTGAAPGIEQREDPARPGRQDGTETQSGDGYTELTPFIYTQVESA